MERGVPRGYGGVGWLVVEVLVRGCGCVCSVCWCWQGGGCSY